MAVLVIADHDGKSMRDTTAKRGKALKYFRAEVYLKEGGQDYDIMGWSEDQVIADVIDQYEKHMHFFAWVAMIENEWVRQPSSRMIAA